MRNVIFSKSIRAASLGLLLATATLWGQNTESPKQLAPATSEALGKLKALEDAKNFDGVLAVLDAIPKPAPTSYDMALILNARANTYLRKEQYTKAIEPMEQALELGTTYKYFETNALVGLASLLGQLCAQEGLNSKVPDVQLKYFDKALMYMNRSLVGAKKTPPETMVLMASIYYYKAVANPAKIDMATLNLAKAEVEKGLVAFTHPKDSFYTLLLSILQQQNDYARSTELIEIYLKQNPQKKDFWQALMGSYLNLYNAASEAKDENKAREHLIRVIVTMERAQNLGFMQTSKDYMSLVSLYNMANQSSRAAEILYDALKSKKVDADPKLWQTLAQMLQQSNQELRAISVLQEATAQFPNNGQLELQIGEIYRGLERTKDAHQHYRAAVKKGGLEKPYFVHQVLAYAAFELEEFDEALDAIHKAEAIAPPNNKDPQLNQLKEAIQGAIDERKARTAKPATK